MKINSKKILTHVAIIVICLVVSIAYFYPVLQGKVVYQSDTLNAQAMSAEQDRYRETTGEYTHWTPGMFSGMPSYQISAKPQQSIFTTLKRVLIMRDLGWERDIAVLFLYLLGFYICLVALGANPWISLIGAIAFGLGSYNIIILEAGHITKGWAISMMAPILAGMVLAFKKKYVWGGILFTLALGLQITFNHIQITYYTALMAGILGLVYLIFAIREKTLKQFFTGVVVLLIGSVFVLATNASHLVVNQEYAKYTMRGGSEISVTPEDLYKDGEPKSIAGEKSGLNIDYAYNWSYGKGETFTIMVPGFYGGGSGEKVSHESEFYKNFHSEHAPLYWGDQPFTSGPVYFGAIIVFLFVFGLFVVKGPERWWLLIAAALAIIMSWGKHFGFNEFLFDNLPYYNKFRTPSMSLVIANVAMVILAVLALKAVFDRGAENAPDQKKLNRGLYISAGITAGLCLIFIVFAGSFSYSGLSDEQMAQQYGQNWPFIEETLMNDRKSLLMGDSFRSLALIVLAAGAIWLFVNQKIKKAWLIVAAIAALVVFDLWGVDKRYLNESNFVSKNQFALYPTQEDMSIDQAAAETGDKDYRVLDLVHNTFNDAKPSAFHHQIGGYHAAKLRRYQDIIDFYISRHINMSVLNMLNARYFVTPDGIQRNMYALGNAWFVDKYHLVDDANAEILALNKLNPADTAVVGADFAEMVKGKDLSRDSNSTIEMQHQTPYNPDYVAYKTHTTKEQLAVFSEIYYAPDWRAYIDGQPAEYLRVNYILRAMVVPAGDHQIEFRNEGPTKAKWDKITLASSIVLVVVIIGTLVIYYIRKRKDETLPATADNDKDIKKK
ncbi:MAG: hypothetical protein IK032_05160 [Bacteroidales bacterium]|nr:hypothetical protein [Bacteroidales bacterium]